MKEVPAFREAARRLLERELATTDGPDELTHAAIEVFTKLLATLASLFGQPESLALFRRSLQICPIPFFDTLRDGKPGNLLTTVAARLREQPSMIPQASEALLVTHLELLASFIGAQLAAQLLQQAWPDIDTTSAQEKKE